MVRTSKVAALGSGSDRLALPTAVTGTPTSQQLLEVRGEGGGSDLHDFKQSLMTEDEVAGKDLL